METKTIIILVITLLPMAAMLISLFSAQPSNLRLPTHIWPNRYNITIKSFMDEEDDGPKYTFKGDVEIRIQTLVRSKILVLHSKKLRYTVHEYWCEESPKFRQSLERFRYDVKTERIIFELNDNIQPGRNYILHFKYTGLIRNETNGLFRNEYFDYDNQHRWVVATQFEPAEARSVFPCFDEPQFKAKFLIRIVRPSNMKAYSNTRRTCSNMEGKYTTDTFALTPKMSTYSIAFLIAPFEERTDGNLSILARSEEIPLTEYSFHISRDILEVLNNYLELNYYEMGIDILQMVAMPRLNFRGMENWGLVMIEHSFLIYNSALNSFRQEQQIKSLLAHELSHMWFGNLVTCNWWSSIWLNEGFAAYFSYYAIAMLENDFAKWERYFFSNIWQKSLSADASDDVSGLNIQSNQITRSIFFSSISYHKGASIIRMVRHIVGEDNFRLSLVEYLKKYKYSTVTPENLFNIWSKYWPPDHINHLQGFCQSFFEQKGFPLITVNIASNNRSFEITQQRFIEKFEKNGDNSLIYTVPITYTTNLKSNFINTIPMHFLSTAKEEITLSPNTQINWIILNMQSAGYYRVNYNKENWRQISNALQEFNFSGIHLLNRIQIIDDTYHLFCTGHMSSKLVLEVLNYLRTEMEIMPWEIALKGLPNILWHSSFNYYQTANYVQNIIENIYNKVGFEPKTYVELEDDKTHENIVNWACKYGNPACFTKAEYYFEHTEELENLPNYLQHIVYCTIVREEGVNIYEKLMKLYHESTSSFTKTLLLNALGCIKDPDLVEKHFWTILQLPLSADDKLNALKVLYTANSERVYQVYRLVTRHYQQVVESLESEKVVANSISEMAPYFTEYYEKKNFLDFNKKTNRIKCEKAKQTLQRALDNLERGFKCYEVII